MEGQTAGPTFFFLGFFPFFFLFAASLPVEAPYRVILLVQLDWRRAEYNRVLE
jgi:hypothetical protein